MKRRWRRKGGVGKNLHTKYNSQEENYNKRLLSMALICHNEEWSIETLTPARAYVRVFYKHPRLNGRHCSAGERPSFIRRRIDVPSRPLLCWWSGRNGITQALMSAAAAAAEFHANMPGNYWVDTGWQGCSASQLKLSLLLVVVLHHCCRRHTSSLLNHESAVL